MVQSKTELFEKELAEMAGLFKALAHPARLRILQFLAESKTCITGDISGDLPLSRTTVNQHLTELKKVGLIQGQIDGVKTNYCIDPVQLNEFQKTFDLFLKNINLKNCKC